MLKYLRDDKLKISFNGKDVLLGPILVSDFDLLNNVLRGYGNPSLEAASLKSAAIQALADRLLEKAKIPVEQMQYIQDNLIAFYFQFGIELDMYLPALFPQSNDTDTDNTGDETPLAQKSQSSNSPTA